MAKELATQLIEQLQAAGVQRIYGIVGDSLNPIVDAVRKKLHDLDKHPDKNRHARRSRPCSEVRAEGAQPADTRVQADSCCQCDHRSGESDRDQ